MTSDPEACTCPMNVWYSQLCQSCSSQVEPVDMIMICVDCLMISSNGRSFDTDDVVIDRYIKAVEANNGEPVALHDEGHVSTKPCDFCGDQSAGDKWEATIVEMNWSEG